MAGNILLWQMLIKFVLVVVLVFGLVGVLVGGGLIFATEGTLRALRAMNRWTSFRTALKSVEIPRDTGRFAHEHRRWLGVCLVLGGVFAAFGLASRINATAAAALFAKGAMVPVVAIAAEAVKWFLIIGSVAGVVVGLMLCLYPNALNGLERHANRWVSSRQAMRGADNMHLGLDGMVEHHPKPAGWLFASTALGVVIYAGMLLTARV